MESKHFKIRSPRKPTSKLPNEQAAYLVKQAIIEERKRIGEWLEKNTAIYSQFGTDRVDFYVFTIPPRVVLENINALKSGRLEDL